MRAFACDLCGQWLAFDTFGCLRCGAAYRYLPTEGRLAHVEHAGSLEWVEAGQTEPRYRRCGNAVTAVCNWVIAPGVESNLCVACRLNRTIPNLQAPYNLSRWRRIEAAKRRMVYGLLRLGLAFDNRKKDPQSGLAFDFLSDDHAPGSVTTGHLQGLVTLNVSEADDAVREQVRTAMGEPYRTLVGHLRHEVGHYYWDRLISSDNRLDQFRECFGDDREDYGTALANHHQNGPPSDWAASYVSAYASSHAWEDWAETWAHYLHIVDAMETAYAYGLAPQSREPGADQAISLSFDPYVEDRFDEVLRALTPLAFAINSLNRSLGQPDLYPFSLSPTVHQKLLFIHRVIREHRF